MTGTGVVRATTLSVAPAAFPPLLELTLAARCVVIDARATAGMQETHIDHTVILTLKIIDSICKWKV